MELSSARLLIPLAETTNFGPLSKSPSAVTTFDTLVR